MSKRKVKSFRQVENWLLKGHGQGHGPEFRPFFKVRDVPSQGRSHRVEGIKTNRIHEYLSDNEYFPHVLCEFASYVTDIREQFALLPWEEPQEIAEQLGIRYPTYPGTTIPIVMTTDIVASLSENRNPLIGNGDVPLPIAKNQLMGKYLPICAKPEEYLPQTDSGGKILPPKSPAARRVLEKILIEKVYWNRRGLPLEFANLQRISLIRAQNLDNHRINIIARELDWLMKYIPYFCDLFMSEWRKDRSLNEIRVIIGKKLNLDEQNTAHLFGRSLWLRQLPIDLDSELILPNFPIKLTTDETEGMVSNV